MLNHEEIWNSLKTIFELHEQRGALAAIAGHIESQLQPLREHVANVIASGNREQAEAAGQTVDQLARLYDQNQTMVADNERQITGMHAATLSLLKSICDRLPASGG